MRGLRRGITRGVTAICAFVALSSAAVAAPVASATAATTTSHGCASGYFCIYASDATWNSGQPSYAFYYYGAHNIYNQYGNHWVYNHQTGGAQVIFCAGADGTGSAIDGIDTPDYSHLWDLTPVNSIVLDPHTYNGSGMVSSPCATSAHNQGWYP